MDQIKIGNFLKELRKDKALTQEQLAEHFNVSSRTVSRWENGNNMPDISILVELAEFYGIELREIIDGERKSEGMDKETNEVVNKVVDYTSEDKESIIKKIQKNSVWALIGIVIYGLFAAFDFSDRFSMIRIGAYYLVFFSIAEILLFASGKAAEMRKNKTKMTVYLVILIVITVTILALAGIFSSLDWVGVFSN